MADSRSPGQRMGRRPSASKRLSDCQERYAQEYAAGKTKLEAATLAGFEFPANEVTRLTRNRAVQDRIIQLQHPYAVTWQRLLLKSRKILNEHLDGINDYAKELLRILAAGGQITPEEFTEFIKMLKVSAADRNTAVRLVLDSMAKINPRSLSDAAGSEDAAMTRDEAVRAMLGEDAEGEPASDEAPGEPGEDEPESELEPEPEPEPEVPAETTH